MANKSKLSERLVESAKDVFPSIADSDYMRKVLMYGVVDDECRAIGHRHHKAFCDSWPQYKQFLTDMANRKDLSAEEKHFFRTLFDEMVEKYDEYLEEMIKTFGTPDKHLWGTDARNPYANRFWFSMANNCPLVQVLSPLMAMLATYSGEYKHLMKCSAFLDSDVAKRLQFRTFNVDKALEGVTALIDKRSDSVSKEDELLLCKLFRQSMETEVDYQLKNFQGY